MIVFGLDPGATGGIAAIVGDDPIAMKLENATDDEIFRFVAAYRGGEPVAYLEDPRGIAPGIRTPKSIAGPAESFGFLRGLLVAVGIRRVAVRPQKWQRGFNLPKRADVGDTAKKAAHREAAGRLFPTIRATNWNADALLIAEYGRREIAAGR